MRPVLAFAVCLLFGCGAEAPQLGVNLTTDYVAARDFARIRTDLLREFGVAEDLVASQTRNVDAGESFSQTRVATFEPPEAGTYLLRVTLVASSGIEVASTQTRVSVVDSIEVTMVLGRSADSGVDSASDAGADCAGDGSTDARDAASDGIVPQGECGIASA